MRVESLTVENRAPAGRVLIESFRDYPYMRHALRDAGSDYEAHLEKLILFILDARWARRDRVRGGRRDGRLCAVATVVGPGPAEPSADVEALFQRLRRDIGADAVDWMERYEEAAHVGRPEAPFHYLGMLGVLPDRQGSGHGKRLVDDVKRRAREHPTSTGVVLNTEVERNVALYEHLGFEVVGEGDVGELHTWCMLWPAPGDAP